MGLLKKLDRQLYSGLGIAEGVWRIIMTKSRLIACIRESLAASDSCLNDYLQGLCSTSLLSMTTIVVKDTMHMSIGFAFLHIV